MFLSLPHYEFQAPQGLGEPGSRYWRVVEMELHAPWFLLSVLHPDPEGQGLGTSYTLCIAWELDLAKALRRIEAGQVGGLVAMMPGWATPTGTWSSRQITEVWLEADETGRFVTFKDAAGEEFDGRMRGIPPRSGAASELLLRLPPGRSRAQRPPSSETCCGRRRAAHAADAALHLSSDVESDDCS